MRSPSRWPVSSRLRCHDKINEWNIDPTMCPFHVLLGDKFIGTVSESRNRARHACSTS